MQDITIKFNPSTNSFETNEADFNILNQNLILFTDAQGNQFKVFMTSEPFDVNTEVADLQEKEVEIQAEIQKDTALQNSQAQLK